METAQTGRIRKPGQGTPVIDGAQKTMWIFEPHVVESVFEDFEKEYKIVVRRGEWLDREKKVKLQDGQILEWTDR